MKIFRLLTIAFMAVILTASVQSNAQTSGTLTFSVTTTEPSGGYTGDHVIALWIENSAGTFIKTKIRYAQARVSYLNVWISKSSQNVVDATTGPTKSSHGTLTFTWNATNVSSVVVPDDTYKIWLQMADRNQNGATASVTFTKGPTPISNQTFANSGNFTNMSLNWVPVNSGILTSGQPTAFNAYPNPFTSDLFVDFSLSDMQRVTAVVYDVNGKQVKVLSDKMLAEGKQTLSWDASDESGGQVSNGIYFIKLTTAGKTSVKKVYYSK